VLANTRHIPKQQFFFKVIFSTKIYLEIQGAKILEKMCAL
jgi:hypothetical protein